MFMDAAWCGLAMEDGGSIKRAPRFPSLLVWAGRCSPQPLPQATACPQADGMLARYKGGTYSAIRICPWQSVPLRFRPPPSSLAAWDPTGTACNVPCLPVMPASNARQREEASDAPPGCAPQALLTECRAAACVWEGV